MNLADKIRLLTTDQREFIDFYTEPIRGDELPLDTRIRVIDPTMSWWYGKTGTIVGYHQPHRGWAEWYWVTFDGERIPDNSRGPIIHREKFEVIE